MHRKSIRANVSIVLAASIACVFMAMITNIIIARTLGPAMKGQVDLFAATVMLATACFSFSLSSGVTYVVARSPVHLRRLVSLLIITSCVQGLLLLGTLLLLRRWGMLDKFVPAPYASWGPLVVALATTFAILGGYFRSYFAGLQQFTKTAIYDIAQRLVAVMGLVVGIVCFYPHLEQATAAAIWGLQLAPFGLTFIAGLLLWKLNKSGPSSEFNIVWRYALPCYLGNIAQFLNYRLDVFVINSYSNTAELAKYTAAVSIAQLLWLPPQAMQNVLLPNLTSLDDKVRQAETAARSMRLGFALTAAMGIALAVAGPWVITLLFGHRFDGSIQPLRLLLPGVTIFPVATVLAAYLGAIGKPRLNLLASLAGLFPTVILLLWLVPWMGIAGAAIASSVAYATSSICILVYFCKESRLSLGKVVLPQRVDAQLVWNLVTQVWKR